MRTRVVIPRNETQVRYLKLVVDDQLGNKLCLERRQGCEKTEERPRGNGLTNPNMYTKDVKVEMTKLYQPRLGRGI